MIIQIAQFILSLSILIVLHELGHFIPAKLFKTKVEKFYLFFDPYFSLFKIKRGETEYGLGWLPLGGYVKIAGMIDESMDKEQMKLPPQPWEFRAKPAWQRLIIMIGGVTVNVILGILIYALVLFAWGEQLLPLKNVKYGVAVDSIGYNMGLRDGDMIVSVGNRPVRSLQRVSYEALIDDNQSVQVERDGKILSFPVTEDTRSKMIKNKSKLVEARVPCVVDSLLPDMPAIKQGFRKGDQIIAMDGKPTPFFNDVTNFLRTHKYQLATATVLRGTDSMHIVTPVNGNGQIGFVPKFPDAFLKFDTLHYSFLQSFPAGIHKAYETFDGYLKQMKVIFTVKGAHEEIGGFASIAKAYGTTWDWQNFWVFTAFLSIVLAIMNILPIPALDGGHVVFLLYEVITGRKPNEKVLEYAQYAGMILLLALLLYANGNDVLRWIKGV